MASEKTARFDTGAVFLSPRVKNKWVMTVLFATCIVEKRGKGLQLPLEPSSTLAQQRAHGGQLTTLLN